MSIVAQLRSRHKAERAALATAQKSQKLSLSNIWKGELKTVLLLERRR